MSTPTPAVIRQHLAEHYGLTMAQVVELLRTPTHPAGMRDEFALAAMPYALDCCCPSYDAAAKIAYTVADAMLVERVK